MSALDRPTILVVGGGERMQQALEVALERHDLMVESAPTESIVEAAFAAAPDLLLMLGDATHDGGVAALSRLSGHPAAALVPVVLLLDSEPPENLAAFRHGVVAVVQKTASADGMAREIARLAGELPERSGELAGELGEASVDELVQLFSQKLRSGILSVSSADGRGSTQVVIRAGRPVAEAIEELVERMRPLVRKQPGPLRYEFHESPAARLSLFDEGSSANGGDGALEGRRVLLIEQNPARADQLVQELRDRGALVVVADGDGTGLGRARPHDPDVVILDGSGVESWAMGALRQLRRDPRLRWASLLLVDAAELWPGGRRPSLDGLERAVATLMKPDRDLTRRAVERKTFETRLELVGPGRLLRALVATEQGLKLTTRHPRVRVEIDLAEGLVAGARAFDARGKEELAEGPAAIAAWLGLGSGRVRVERKEAPATANVMAPVDDALAAAARERPPIRPSLPPPSGLSHAPAPAAAAAAAPSPEAERLLGRLETLLVQLQSVLPDAPPLGATEATVEPAPEPPPDDEEPAAATIEAATVVEPLEPKVTTPPWEPFEEDEDIPVIEATAEPGGLAQTRPVTRESVPAPPGEPPAPSADSLPPLPPRRRPWLAIGLGGLVLLGAVGGGAYYLATRAPDPPEGVGPLGLADGDAGAAERAPDAGGTDSATHGDAADGGASVRDAGSAPDGSPDLDASALEDGDVGEGDDGGPDEGGLDAGDLDAGDLESEDLDAGALGPDEPDPSELDPDAPDTDGGLTAGERPRDVRFHIRSGNFERNRGNYREAERHYLQVLRREPRNSRALAGLARMAISRRDGTQAVRWAGRLARVRPTNPNNHVLLGDAHRAAGNMDEARRAWRRALEIHPGHENARRRLRGR